MGGRLKHYSCHFLFVWFFGEHRDNCSDSNFKETEVSGVKTACLLNSDNSAVVNIFSCLFQCNITIRNRGMTRRRAISKETLQLPLYERVVVTNRTLTARFCGGLYQIL